MRPPEGRFVTAYYPTSGYSITGIVKYWHNHDLTGFYLLDHKGEISATFYDCIGWEPNTETDTYVDPQKSCYLKVW